MGFIMGDEVINARVGPRYAPEWYSPMPSGILPQLQMGMSIPVRVAHRMPRTRVVPRLLLCSTSGVKNSCRHPATIRLSIIQEDAPLSILTADLKTAHKNSKNAVMPTSTPPQTPFALRSCSAWPLPCSR